MPLLRRKSVLVAKIETTAGTAIAVGAADGVFHAIDVEIKPEADTVDRQIQGTFSKYASTVGARRGVATFKIEMHGLGSIGSPAWATTFLPACGLTATGRTWAPKTEAPGTNVKTLTIARYVDGRRVQICGAAGNVKFVAENGKIAMAEFTFTGKYSATADVALVAPTFPTVTPPRTATATLTLGGGYPKTGKIEIDLGNDVQMLEDVTDTTAAGYSHAIIVDRKPVISLTREAVLVATYDTFGLWLSGTTAAFAFSFGSGAWNFLAFAAPAVRHLDPSEVDVNGIAGDQVTLLCCRSAANDDELTLGFASNTTAAPTTAAPTTAAPTTAAPTTGAP
jgi:hypothetical protein